MEGPMYRVFLCLVNIVFVVFADANVFSQEKKLQVVIGGGISRFFGPAGIGKFYSIGLNGKVGASYQFDPDWILASLRPAILLVLTHQLE